MYSLSSIKKLNDQQVAKETSRKVEAPKSENDDKCFFYAGKWRTLAEYSKLVQA